MTIAITNQLLLAPAPFSAGLELWSQGNGTENEANWATAHNAGIVPDDQHFGTCLEIRKERATTRIRYQGDTPVIPGTYLRVSARIKVLSGPLCSVRIAGWPRDRTRAHVAGLPETGPVTAVRRYNEAVEVSAIVGAGARQGVDMAWGIRPTFGHFGLDLIGDNGSAIRIESLRIENVTTGFVPALIDWVDVLDFGAKGDGVTDDRAAFIAADNAANGGSILVPEGEYFIGGNLSINSRIRFKGRLKTSTATRVSLLKSFDLPTYADAFGGETPGFRKALQALLGYTDHVTLDLCGRRVEITEPLQVHRLVPDLSGYSNRRVIANGSLLAVAGDAWNSGIARSMASYDPANPTALTNVANVAAIEPGSLVTGTGVGREVYVKSRNIGKRRLELSQPLYGGAGTRQYSFERFRYLLDFSGLEQLARFNFVDLDINCQGVASAIMLARDGQTNAIRNCYVTRPKDRGVTSIGRGCQDLMVDGCQFISNELDILAQERKSIAINVNANDVKIRHSRFVRFAHFMIAHGGGHIISGNHWFQGDSADAGLRYAGLVLTQPHVQVTVTGNYVDNASIEWTNEHSEYPDFNGQQYSFGALTITGNTFLTGSAVPWFAWLIVKPYGKGHYLHGLSVVGNVFKTHDSTVERIERVDNSIADLNYGKMRNVHFGENTFNGVSTYVANPLLISLNQNTAASSWTSPELKGLPFKGRAMSVASVVAESRITNASGTAVTQMPWVQTQIGTRKRQIRLNWSGSAKGRVAIYARMDRPH